ncbi:replication-relaxation family protein [Streptomyces sp. NPDC050658]|uniref:replication-relaxation family protein n=1 Tax=unclassified Streptomyces TaxID=2593676 RepID=UPI003449FF4E
MITNPNPQRSLRGHRPARLSGRTAATGDYIARLAPRLTPRDRWLIRMLYEHRVLTTHQITELAWPSVRAANIRLLQLYKWRVFDRFQPFISYGSAPMHYVLDVTGAAVLARETGVEVRDLGYRHERAVGIAYSLRLAHAVGVNGFFTALIEHSRRPGSGDRLTAWWSEGRCSRHFGDVVRPDAYGRWRERSGELEWFLEYDCGTERPADRVSAKLPGYVKLADHTGITTPVLFWTNTTQREVRLRSTLAEAQAALGDPLHIPIATASAERLADESMPGPSSACWLPLRAGTAPHRRFCLVELTMVWPQLAPLACSAPGVPGGGDTVLPVPPPAPQPPASSVA